MANDLPSERDLRDALRTLVPDDLDAADFRARLDLLLAESPAEPAGPPAEHPEPDDTVPLQPIELAPRRRRPSRAALVAIMAACAAAVVAVAIAVVPHGRDSRPAPLAASPSVPAPIRSMLYPGTVVLHTYRGHGSQTIEVPSRTIPAHFGYTVYGTCSGGGSLDINGAILPTCTQGSGFGDGPALDHGRIVVTAKQGTTWELTLTLAPDTRTNGSVQTPVDSDLLGPDGISRASGRGSGTATFTEGPASDSTYSVRLVCRGSGVTLPDLDAQNAKGLSTKTCFAGSEYVWQGVRITAPIRVRVVAAPGTTWTIVID